MPADASDSDEKSYRTGGVLRGEKESGERGEAEGFIGEVFMERG
jgi:hypothetical protein